MIAISVSASEIPKIVHIFKSLELIHVTYYHLLQLIDASSSIISVQ